MFFKYKHRLLGAHVHVDVFIGENPRALGRSGTLVMREDEWAIFRATQDAADMVIGGPAGFVVMFENTAASIPATAGVNDLVRLLDMPGGTE